MPPEDLRRVTYRNGAVLLGDGLSDGHPKTLRAEIDPGLRAE